MNSRQNVVFSHLYKRTGLSAALFAVLISACSTHTNVTGPIEMVSRASNTVSRGVISTGIPDITRITVAIDRRIYMGASERTAPNATFGLVIAHGDNGRAEESVGRLAQTRYYRAILSSADHRVLRCDLTGRDGNLRAGICVDDFGRVYDVSSGSKD